MCKGSTLLRSRAELHKTQGWILAINTFWQVNMARLINLLWLLLQKDYMEEFPSVQLSENTCKTYLFLKKKYFAPMEMLFNVLEQYYRRNKQSSCRIETCDIFPFFMNMLQRSIHNANINSKQLHWSIIKHGWDVYKITLHGEWEDLLLTSPLEFVIAYLSRFNYDLYI